MFNPEITMDSFGDSCPKNWEEIADFLNAIIERYRAEASYLDEYDDLIVDEDALRRDCDRLWEAYCAGDVIDAPKPIWD